MKTYDIVIPHMNAPHINVIVFHCLRSIRRFSRDYRVIWVQNGGQIPSAAYNQLLECEAHRIIANKVNQGFVQATNQGMKASDAPFVVLLNNDTEVCAGWLEKLQRPLLDGYGISGPLSSAVNSWQGRWQSTGPDFIDVPEDKPLAFFCTMLRRDVIEKVGYLDEGYGLGLGDDDDFCYRVQRAGFKTALVQNLRITHRHRTTFRMLFGHRQIVEIQRKAIARLKQKGFI